MQNTKIAFPIKNIFNLSLNLRFICNYQPGINCYYCAILLSRCIKQYKNIINKFAMNTK